MNLVSLLILPAVITLADDNVRFIVAAVAVVIVVASIVHTKRQSSALNAD